MFGLILSLAAIFAQPQPVAPAYAEGQVWEYRVRPGDEGSLLKIQRIEDLPENPDLGPVYHISVIGFRLTNPQMVPVLQHAPVSKETLDKSVVRLSRSRAEFPDIENGFAEWKRAQGGVFTISISEIVDLIDAQSRSIENQPPVE